MYTVPEKIIKVVILVEIYISSYGLFFLYDEPFRKKIMKLDSNGM
jgi:hypothetical protein